MKERLFIIMLLNYIFNLTIQPIIYLIQLVFYFAYMFSWNCGLSIVAVSVVINLICFPLYHRADMAQLEEDNKQKSMQKWLDHIKKNFSGDEKLMITNAYYRECDYSPVKMIRSMLPLLLQIPFFIAAYRYLSSVQLFRGTHFLFIRDLSLPDGLLAIGGIQINILPILMTMINIISALIYTRGKGKKAMIQPSILAMVFLVLLYSCPSGLVMYWTLNNTFSLMKNLLMKANQRAKHIICWILATLGCVIAVYLFSHGNLMRYDGALQKQVLNIGKICAIIVISVALMIPLLKVKFIKRSLLDATDQFLIKIKKSKTTYNTIWIVSGILLSLLIGAEVPLSVIASSPTEFIDITYYMNPAQFAVLNFCVFSGIFLVWGGIFYYLMPARRSLFSVLYGIMAVVVLINYYILKPDFGLMTVGFGFVDGITFDRRRNLINLACIILIAIVVGLLICKCTKLMKDLLITGVLLVLVLCIKELGVTLKETRSFNETRVVSDSSARMTLSKTGKNVVVFMIDRVVGETVKYVFEDRPDIKERFDGFTWYPNTVSLAAHTQMGAPGLYGGYEYAPQSYNRRTDISIVDKHNEAMKVMPVLFSDNGFDVFVNDPPNANYKPIGDIDIYDGYPNIKAYNMINGEYRYLLSDEEQEQVRIIKDSDYWKFFIYSIFATCPDIAKKTFYNDGRYMSLNGSYPKEFLDSYSVMEGLSKLTEVEDSGNHFIMMYSLMAHTTAELQEPDYHFVGVSHNQRSDDPVRDYDINNPYFITMRAYDCLAEWFDFMRENGVYDNTRIIIVSDHGSSTDRFGYTTSDGLQVARHNPVLLVKDFDAHGFNVDDTFMTNADTPTLVLKDIIDNPVNPFTGNAINDDMKKQGKILITTSDSRLDNPSSKVYHTNGDWYTVHDNIWVDENWTDLGPADATKGETLVIDGEQAW